MFNHKKLLGLYAVFIIIAALTMQGVPTRSAASEVQTISGGGVNVKVVAKQLKIGESPRFEVVLDTHTVALDGYDLKALAVLRDDNGNQWSPSKLENKGSGHHRSVALTFPKLPAGVKRLELAIKDIAGIKERKFQWAVP